MNKLTPAQRRVLVAIADTTFNSPMPFGNGNYGVNARAAKSLENMGLACTCYDLGDDGGGAGGCAWITPAGTELLRIEVAQ